MSSQKGLGCDSDIRAAVADGIGKLMLWAVEAAQKPLPDEVLSKAALVLVDDVAAISAAHSVPEVAALYAGIQGRSHAGEARVYRPGAPAASRQDAALINGVAGCWLELDEGFRGAPCHAGLYVIPALLAEAETRALTLEHVLAVLAVAYEVTSRMAETWKFPAMSVHPHAAFASLGASCGAGLARGLPAEKLIAALNIAGGMVPAGTYQAAVEGALVRNLWVGMSSCIGMQALDLAEAGFDGYEDGPHPAFTQLLNAEVFKEKLTDNLGKRWAIQGGYHKLHGCCHSTHAAAEAALEAAGKLRAAGGAQRVETIELFTHRPSMSNRAPKNTLAARFSFEHVVAAALSIGSTGPQAFSEEVIEDPEVAFLRNRVRLLPYEPLPAWPEDRPARLVITMDDGRQLDTECMSAPGGPDHPISAEMLLQKVAGLTADDFPSFPDHARSIVEGNGGMRGKTWQEIIMKMLARP